MFDIVVVGGGASGMMASIVAGRQGKKVLLLERNDRLGKKLLATGNGRCNYTNRNLSIENYHGENPKFALSGLSQFSVDKTMEFFEGLGITPVVENNGKVFPHSYQSSSFLDVLSLELEHLKVDVELLSFVRDIEKMEDGFKVYTEDRAFLARKLILATGGLALPNSGSDGIGYNLVKNYGHSLTDLSPGLVQLKLFGDVFKPLSGVKFEGLAGLYVDGNLVRKDRGDILFTDYGISGPPILQLSREAIRGVNLDKKVELSLSIVEDKTFDEVLAYLYYRFSLMGYKKVGEGLIGLVNSKLIGAILKEVGINPSKYISSMRDEEIRELSRILIDWKFEVSGSKSYKFAQVTVGGLDTESVDNQTLESKLVEGLYFTGEILDVDGDCGGYNLQWAWSSAYVAGINASRD